MSNCLCDAFAFPPRRFIRAGLTRLPRQLAGFPEFRRALLHDLGQTPALRDWRGRQPDDFGVMLLELWAYVCDVTAFYDDVLAHEFYLRTARRRAALLGLTGLLGYRPRPAVGATVELAAFAEGRQAVILPAGTAFRSEAFAGQPPQVFELTQATLIHPLFNEWAVQPNPVRPATFGGAAQTVSSFLCAKGSVTLKVKDLALIRIDSALTPGRITAVSDFNGGDGTRYTKVEFDTAVVIPAGTPVAKVELLKPTVTAGLWTGPGGEKAIQLDPAGGETFALLDSKYRNVRTDQITLLEYAGNLFASRITKTEMALVFLPIATNAVMPDSGAAKAPNGSGPKAQFKPNLSNASTGQGINVPIPGTNQSITKLGLEPNLATADVFDFAAGSDVAVHLNFMPAGNVTIEADPFLQPGAALRVPPPLEKPVDAAAPGIFQLEDKDQFGAAVAANLDFATGDLQPGQGAERSAPLRLPLRLFGNIITATRGETVTGESLGVGDGSQSNQTFTLKKSPLTYLPDPSRSNLIGARNTLRVYVDGLEWTETPTFFQVADQAPVYIVREDETGASRITFGDGARGARLPTGARVTANYRFGAGAASPPAGGIHQLARPARGLTSVRNPVAAHGGADAEPAEQVRKYAPQSALLLGRAVSLADLEAAAAGTPGVRAVRVEWRWNHRRQRPLAQIYYIGDPALDVLIIQKLRELSEPDTAFDVRPAQPLARALALQLAIDSRYLPADVLARVRARLMDPETGWLAPERVGIGLPLFRSRIYECVLGTPGATAVTALQLDGAALTDWGLTPGAGNYFDFEQGALLLNGHPGSP